MFELDPSDEYLDGLCTLVTYLINSEWNGDPRSVPDFKRFGISSPAEFVLHIEIICIMLTVDPYGSSAIIQGTEKSINPLVPNRMLAYNGFYVYLAIRDDVCEIDRIEFHPPRTKWLGNTAEVSITVNDTLVEV